MHSINLFVEDRAHELFLEALVDRLAEQYGTPVEVRPSSVRGGHGTEALVDEMNLEYLERAEPSLGRLLKELRHKFQEWERDKLNELQQTSEA